MRTTYRAKSGNTNVNQNVSVQERQNVNDVERVVPKQKVVSNDNKEESTQPSPNLKKYSDLYMELSEAAELSNSVDDALFASPNEDKVYDDGKQKKKKFPILAILLIFLVICACGFGVFYIMGSKGENKIVELSETINRLYTDENKSDIKSDITQETLNSLYTSINELSDKGQSVEGLKAEVDCISKYIEDKSTVSKMMASDYDLRTEGIDDVIAGLRANAGGYSVPGLALTLNDMISSLQNDLTTYRTLLSELQGVTDYINFDTAKYEESIRNITHEPNKNELTEIYTGVVAKQIEESGKKALEDKAKEETDKAKDKALEDAEKAKSEAEEKAKDAEDKLKQVVEDAKNKATEETTVESNTEATTQTETSSEVQ